MQNTSKGIGAKGYKMRFTPGTAIALVALFFSLGGGALAGSRAGFYVAEGGGKALSLTTPTARASVHCAPGDQAISGGYVGGHETVTLSSVIAGPARLSGWTVAARLASGHSRGLVAAEVVCAR